MESKSGNLDAESIFENMATVESLTNWLKQGGEELNTIYKTTSSELFAFAK